MKADLHVHTTASDGTRTPRDVVHAAAQAGISLVAVTDHDTIAGIDEACAQARAEGIALLTGVELSVVSSGLEREIHLLGYGLNPDAPALCAHFQAKRAERECRMRAMVEKARSLGMDMRFQDVQALASGVLSRSHIAKCMVDRGYAPDVRTAFERYLNPGKPVYEPRERTGMAEGLALLRESGAVPVLAHPGLLRMGEASLTACVLEWKRQGLRGLEVYHPSHQANHARFLYRLCRREDLLVTGGSDYHGEDMRDTKLGAGLQAWATCEQDVRALWRQAGTRHGSLL